MKVDGVVITKLNTIIDMLWQLSAQMGNRARYAGDPCALVPPPAPMIDGVQSGQRLCYDPMTMRPGVDPRLVEERDDRIDRLETIRSKQEAANCEMAGKIRALKRENFALKAQRKDTGWARVAELEDVIAHIEKDGDERAEENARLVDKLEDAQNMIRTYERGDSIVRRELERDLGQAQARTMRAEGLATALQDRLDEIREAACCK